MFPAERIKLLRESKDISQIDLCKVLLIGQSTMSEYENGVRQPPVSVLIKIADYFGVSIDYLAGRTNIKITVDDLQEQLVTKSGKKLSIKKLLHLDTDEKEAIIDLENIFHKHTVLCMEKQAKSK